MAANSIETITIDPGLEAVGVLRILVAVRITPASSPDFEIDGVAPWRKRETDARIAALRTGGSGDDKGRTRP